MIVYKFIFIGIDKFIVFFFFFDGVFIGEVFVGVYDGDIAYDGVGIGVVEIGVVVG